MQGRASVQAMGTEGKSVDRLINSYAQSLGDYEAITAINSGIRRRQYTRQQQAVLADYLSRYQSQEFYQEAKYMDPIPPYAPLPTLVMPSGPTMTGGAPGSAATALSIGAGILGGVNTYFSSAAMVKQLKIGG